MAAQAESYGMPFGVKLPLSCIVAPCPEQTTSPDTREQDICGRCFVRVYGEWQVRTLRVVADGVLERQRAAEQAGIVSCV